MSEFKDNTKLDREKIATEISELPPLPKNYMRAVHFTFPEAKDGLLENGLNYEKYGMAMSMARAWSKAEEVEYWSTDPRYSHEGQKILVMDMPAEEWKLHNNVYRRPGIISKERIVGFVNAKKPKTSS
jgi:hypothetical protein